jgi:hypothetical protein
MLLFLVFYVGNLSPRQWMHSLVLLPDDAAFARTIVVDTVFERLTLITFPSWALMQKAYPCSPRQWILHYHVSTAEDAVYAGTTVLDAAKESLRG